MPSLLEHIRHLRRINKLLDRIIRALLLVAYDAFPGVMIRLLCKINGKSPGYIVLIDLQDRQIQ
jgi:hypothetical protein